MWKKVNDVLPEKESRYFVMYTMVPVIIDGEMVRKNFPGVCTYKGERCLLEIGERTV